MTDVVRFNLGAAQDAVARLDEGDYTEDDRPELERLAGQYEAYLQQEQAKRDEQVEREEFDAQWPEPADGARIEWEDCYGDRHAAYRADGRDEQPRRWFMYNDGDDYPAREWQQIVVDMTERGDIRGMADVVLLAEVDR